MCVIRSEYRRVKDRMIPQVIGIVRRFECRECKELVYTIMWETLLEIVLLDDCKYEGM